MANKRDKEVKVAIRETLKAKPHLIDDLIDVMDIWVREYQLSGKFNDLKKLIR